MAKTEQERLTELLSFGQKAKESLYYELLKKINDKEKLTPTEQRTFQTLGKDLEQALLSAPEDDERMGYAEAAAYLQLSKRSVSHHVHKGRIVMHPEGGFLKSELDKYKMTNGYGTGSGGTDMATLKEKADLTLKQVRAQREQFLMKQLSEQYVSVADMHRAWADRVKELATGLMSWENSLPPLLQGRDKFEIRAILSREVRFLLERFARTGKWTSDVAPEIEQVTQLDGQGKSVK